jgi:putative nucleotidyltransferase with HDIG domain
MDANRTSPAIDPLRMKKRILFVDDELQVLDGLSSALRSRRDDWTMVFAQGGLAALEHLDVEPFDVVVSDMRMPGMGGAELLQLVRQRHPETVRLVLSGHSEFEATLDAAPFAHQFLAKPCRSDELQNVIERACELRALLTDVEAQATVAGITSLPAAPHAYRKLNDMLSSPEVAAGDVAGIIEADVALYAKVLQLVNSAFFGLGRRITSAREAVAYLGIAPLRSVVLSVELTRSFNIPRPIEGFSLERLELHSTTVARTAGRLVRSTRRAENAFTAGLLHDIGKLVLASEHPDRLESLLAEARESGRTLHAVEREQTGTTHAEIGAYLLGLWGLPYAVVEAVAHHHKPSAVVAPQLDATGAVAVTNALVGEIDTDATNRGTAPTVNEELLAALGPEADLDAWRLIIAEELNRPHE